MTALAPAPAPSFAAPARSARRPGRATAALVWGAALFLAGQLALCLYIDGRHPERRDLEHGLKWQLLRRKLAACPGRPLVLALGSSRVEWGLRPDALPPCTSPDGRAPLVFNYGMSGAGPFAELLCLRRLRAVGVRPAGVLVEVMPPLLAVNGARPEWVPTHRLAWRDLPLAAHYRPDRCGLLREWLAARAVSCYSYRFSLLNAIAPNWVPVDHRLDPQRLLENCDDSGWGPCPFPSSDGERRRARERSRGEYGELLAHFAVEPASDRALREMLTLCRQENVPAALFVMPEGSAFAALYPPAARAAVDDYLGRLSRECGVPLLDARGWAADGDFWDGHHLLPEGATAFSRRFGPAALPLVLPRRQAEESSGAPSAR
jgi:hypothetical protein